MKMRQYTASDLVVAAHRKALREEFIRLLTEDGPTQDARRKEFNQAIFFPEAEGGRSVYTSTDLYMVLATFDRAVKNLERR